MASVGAERQRRYRAHAKGDHSLCDPARQCDGVTVTPVTHNAPSLTCPAGLRTRGRRLWRDLTDGKAIEPAQRVLIEEACRIADRLDRLDALLTGDAEDWVRLVDDRGDPERQTVVIDKPLAEARQQATALKQIIAELRQAGAVAGTSGKDQPSGEASVRDQLAARRAKRLADAAGS